MHSFGKKMNFNYTQSLHRNHFQQKRGQLLISLMYVPLEGRLVLGVIKASNLRAMDINGSSGLKLLITELE